MTSLTKLCAPKPTAKPITPAPANRPDALISNTPKIAIEPVEGQADPVVGHAVLGEVVGPDPLRAIARADQGPPRLGRARRGPSPRSARRAGCGGCASPWPCSCAGSVRRGSSTTTPVGRWVIRTPLSVLFWCWPPGPPAHHVDLRGPRSGSRCRPPRARAGRRRWRPRCGSGPGSRSPARAGPGGRRSRTGGGGTPPRRVMPKTTSRKPPSSVGTMSSGSNFQPIVSANRRYISYEVAREQGRLVAAGAGADLDDQAGVVGAGLRS